jgi:hypothetical protein
MRWHKWVVLIAGSTGSALRAVCPPNLHITPDFPAGSRSTRKRDGFLVSLAPGHHDPGHPRNLVGQRDGRDLGRAPRSTEGVFDRVEEGTTDAPKLAFAA